MWQWCSSDIANGHPSAQASKSTPSKSLANTGANVAWIGGIALLLLIAGAWLSMRKRRESLSSRTSQTQTPVREQVE
ncbi:MULTISPECIES: LPXTG cell wall anchor domain-containing protein [Corynebacterium]